MDFRGLGEGRVRRERERNRRGAEDAEDLAEVLDGVKSLGLTTQRTNAEIFEKVE